MPAAERGNAGLSALDHVHESAVGVLAALDVGNAAVDRIVRHIQAGAAGGRKAITWQTVTEMSASRRPADSASPLRCFAC